MARIFLSYAHEDSAKAKSLAAALERAGHAVWWDPHVGGGTRFAAEIATALKDCEIVIVLWSHHSGNSTWVQDEAAEGRDTGRLVPILLYDSRPPLGFRQFQAIDLSKWRGRGKVPKLAAIEGAIQTVLQGGTLAGPSEPPRRRNWASRTIAAAVALLLIAVAALYATGQFATKAEAASLAVMPFADFSPERDKAYFAEGVAEEIRTLLAEVPGIQVTGRKSTEMLGQTADFKQARSQLGVTHMLEGSVRVDGQKLRLHVRLLRATDGMQVWAEEFDRELGDIFAVQDQVGAAVAQRLKGTLLRMPLGRKSTRTAIQAFDLMLAGAAKWRQGDQGDSEAYLEAERLFRRATEIDPKYAPAWTALSRAKWVLIGGGRREGAWGPNWLRDREFMLQYARRAVELDPKDADAQAWLGFVEGSINENPELALARIEKAIELNPGDERVWGLASLTFADMCQRDKTIEALRRLAALEPLELYPKQDLMWALYAGGQKDEADALRRKLLQDPGQAKEIADTLARQQGDFSFLIAGRLKEDPGGPKPGVAHMLHALGAIEPAIAFLPSDYRKSLGAYWLRDYRQAAAASDWLQEGYWDTARGFALTRALVRAGRHRDLLRLLDQRFGSIEVFDRRLRCNLPSVAGPVVSALRVEGRSAEAGRLAQLAERRFRQGLAQRHYEEDIHAGYVELLVVAGRREDALVALEQAVQRTGLGQAPPPTMRLDLADPVFDAIRNHPRFKAVERRIAAWRAKELRELAAAGVKI